MPNAKRAESRAIWRDKVLEDKARAVHVDRKEVHSAFAGAQTGKTDSQRVRGWSHLSHKQNQAELLCVCVCAG